MRPFVSISLPAIFALLIGCGSTHLGEDTGVAFRRGFTEQRTSSADNPHLRAQDAYEILGMKPSDSETARARPPMAPAMTSFLRGAVPTHHGPIRLKAK